MKTLTITDAKKNLGRWLSAAAHGEDIGIISGCDIIALRKVEVEAVDDYSYAVREYGVTRGQLKQFDKALDAHINRGERKGRYRAFRNAAAIGKALEKTDKD
jgi:hypothetical protein